MTERLYSINYQKEVMNKYFIFINLLSRRIGAKFVSSENSIIHITIEDNYVIFANFEGSGTKIDNLQNYLSKIGSGNYENIDPVHAIHETCMVQIESLLQGKTGKYMEGMGTIIGDTLSNEKIIEITQIPVIDILVEAIIKGIEAKCGLNLFRCSISDWGVLAVSHDVDHNRLPKRKMLSRYLFLRRKGISPSFGFLVKSILNFIPGIDFCYNYSDFINLEKKYDVLSTYFFLEDTFKEINYNELSKLEEYGHEIEVHGDFDTADSLENMTDQINSMKSHFIPKNDFTGIRQHYLDYSYPKTWEIHHDLKIRYDGTLGFSDMTGFRTGTSTPYLTDRNIVEIPLMIMDTYFRKVASSNLDLFWKEKIISLVNWVAKTSGVLSINWHQAYYNMPFGYFLEFTIKACKDHNLESLTHSEITSKVERQLSILAEDLNHVEISTNGSLDCSDKFRDIFHPKLVK